MSMSISSMWENFIYFLSFFKIAISLERVQIIYPSRMVCSVVARHRETGQFSIIHRPPAILFFSIQNVCNLSSDIAFVILLKTWPKKHCIILEQINCWPEYFGTYNQPCETPDYSILLLNTSNIIWTGTC